MRQLRVLFIVAIACSVLTVFGRASADEASDNRLADELTSDLVCLPSGDIRALKRTLRKLFDGADQSRLMRLADHPNWNVAFWARWELRRTLFSQAFDASNRFYPVRFLELKGIAVPTAWAKEFAAQFLASETIRRESAEYYRAHAPTQYKMSFIGMEPRTWVRYAKADVPAGASVRESEKDLVVTQEGVTVRLEKPLTKNYYAMNTLVRDEDVFLPLITEDKAFILSLRGSHMMPFAFTCFASRSGTQKWETVGWSGFPTKVEVVPRNLLPTRFEAILLGTTVGEIVHPDTGNDRGRGGRGQFCGACSLYLTGNDKLVTVFGSERVLFLEAFDVNTGRNVLRFATDYNGDEAEAAAGQTKVSGKAPVKTGKE
jgi:hypothetical protein